MLAEGDLAELDGRLVTVMAVDHDYPSVMSTPEGDFHPIRFKVREEDGRIHWTCSFADRSRPVA